MEDLSFTRDEHEREAISVMINSAVESIMTTNNRLDGVLYLHQSDALILLTEFNIYEYEKNETKFELTKAIPIQEIDFITLTRDGKKVILHLIADRTYIIKHAGLEKLAACICATYFYDKTGVEIKENNNRQISVIVLNENFQILRVLEQKSDFNQYK